MTTPNSAPTAEELQAQRRQQMADAILQHARDVMRERGAGGLSLGEVARRLGVKTPSLYEYFANKHAIYDAIFRQGYEQFTARIMAGLEQADGGDVRSLMTVHITTYMAFARENPELYQLMFERPIPGFTPSAESLRVSFGALERASEVFDGALRAEGITLPPDLSAAQFRDLWIAFVHGIVALHLANQPDTPLQESRFGSLLDAAVDTFMAAWITPQGGTQ